MKNRDFIYDMKKKKLCGIDLVLQNSQWKIWEGKRWVYAFVQHNKSVYIVNTFSFSFFVYWFYTQYLKSHLVLDIRVTFKGTRDNDLFEKDSHSLKKKKFKSEKTFLEMNISSSDYHL